MIVLLNLLSLITFNFRFRAHQGRLLFPSVVATVGLMVIGLDRLTRKSGSSADQMPPLVPSSSAPNSQQTTTAEVSADQETRVEQQLAIVLVGILALLALVIWCQFLWPLFYCRAP